MSIDFEKAKTEWLKTLNGKSLEQYKAENDQRILLAMEKIGNEPKNKKLWDEAESMEDSE